MGQSPEASHEYVRQITSAVVAAEPRLAAFRVAESPHRASLFHRVRGFTRAMGCLGAPLGAALWFHSNVLHRNRTESARFEAPAPSQPRALRVVHAVHLSRSGLNLTLTVEGREGACSLAWGNAVLRTGASWTPLTLTPIVTAIFDGRAMLLRISRYQEIGMGGPMHRLLCDHLFDRESGRFVHGDAESLKHCCEAVAYSWDGSEDTQVVIRRCHVASRFYHGYAEPPEIRWPSPRLNLAPDTLPALPAQWTPPRW